MGTTSLELVKRIRAGVTAWGSAITEKKMFGGYCTLYNGKMSIGEIKGRLLVRVVPEKMETVLKSPFVTPMDFTGKPMKEFIFVSEGGFTTNEDLQYWIELGIEHAQLKSN
ncbi:TfoX/Sxy family protein [Ulvibacter litoralis]|uniref:Transcriptional regulator of competence genes, TfoX/Sxy family n=1 Tax=Ulvibacter litoralis TaxID=227084 RepID=A0A1G7FQZ1_9FLAO|nr:TfoX/Sxy family protein [Ulvibacter litoralis]GHC50099.1 RNA methyltransferase [Ulvibacter litoralis]SDE78323.1 Transcriptional regulator of competence genes, TfoX/Sxy family [Ulvibacter litoralis]